MASIFRVPTLDAGGRIPAKFLPAAVVTQDELDTALAALPGGTAGVTATPDPDDAEVLVLTVPTPEA